MLLAHVRHVSRPFRAAWGALSHMAAEKHPEEPPASHTVSLRPGEPFGSAFPHS